MKRKLLYLLLIAVGVAAGVAGRSFWPAESHSHGTVVQVSAPGDSPKVWTCSMHPQIRMDHPDLCPLCGMDLTPVEEDDHSSDGPVHLKLSERARSMARVATTEVAPQTLVNEVRTVGRVELDETLVSKITARIDGRVDEVYASFPGTPVKKGEHLVSLYSPELVATQHTFLAAYRPNGAGYESDLATSSRRRLQLWGITDAQIDKIAKSGKPQTHMIVYAPFGGTVIEKHIRPGQYVKEGDSLYTIADLGQVWLVLEVYESELAWVRFGQSVEVTLESEPHRPLAGRVGFVEPTLNDPTRTVKVRVVLKNPEGKLKPGMYAQALIQVPLLPDGKPAPTGLEGKYVCPMHPYEVSDRPGNCQVCGMPRKLVPGQPASPEETPPKVLAVPAEAVLTTGRRQLVYVEREPGDYQLVEPVLGPRAGNYYPVIRGLDGGDRVVTRGNFLLDSQFQVTGKPSLLYPEGTLAGAGHAGHGMEAARTQKPSAQEQAALDKLAPADKAAALAQRLCPITDAPLGSMGMPVKMTVQGRTIFLCCQGCDFSVNEDPEGTLRKVDALLEQAKHAEHGK